MGEPKVAADLCTDAAGSPQIVIITSSLFWTDVRAEVGLQQTLVRRLQVRVMRAAVPDISFRVCRLSLQLREGFARRFARHIDFDPRLHRELARLALAPVGLGGAQDVEVSVGCAAETYERGGNNQNSQLRLPV